MTNINVRINEDTKKEAEKIFADLGLTPTTAINLFYEQVIRINGIPFGYEIDIPNETTMKAINEVEELENNSKDIKTYNSVRELIDDLKA